MLTDLHTHTTFSADGISPMEEMLERAREKSAAYYGITDHFDYGHSGEKGRYWTDAEGYFTKARELQARYADEFSVLVGAEIGYQNVPELLREVNEIVEKYEPDYLINSVHLVKYEQTERGEAVDKYESYERYFSRIRESLEASYRYEIVGHIAFCVRYAPYEDRTFSYADHRETLDGILKRVIELDKILEINSKASPARFDGDKEIEYVPSREILERYYELGGRKISYGSDAHRVEDVLKGRERAVEALKEIGFEYLTIPTKNGEVEIPL